MFENLQEAQDADARRTYDQLAAYVQGDTIPLPGHLSGAACAVGPDPAPQLVDGRMRLTPDGTADVATIPAGGAVLSIGLPEPRGIGHLEVGTIAPEAQAWSGSVHVRALDETGATVADNWRRAELPPTEQGTWRHVIAVPVEAEAVGGLTVRVLPDREQGPLSLDEVTATVPTGSSSLPHIAKGRQYWVEPEHAAEYPDRGGQLTDGVVATEGWPQGRSVGWSGHEVCITLDLGRALAVERCVVHCDGGGYGAVDYPEQVSLRLGAQGAGGLAMTEGAGEPPAPPVASVTATAADIVADFERRAADAADASASGHITLIPGSVPVEARYVVLQFRPRGWLMLSEIEVIAAGQNVARGLSYHSTPRPAPAEEARYPDDGRILVDGYVASGLERKHVCGWDGVEAAQVTIDLGAVQKLGSVTVHALGGGLHGVCAPGRVVVEVSEDGASFRVAAEAAQADPGDGTCVHVPTVVRPKEACTARYVRVRLLDLRGWTLLSEVEVRP